MFVDRYQVEIQNPVTQDWEADRCFRLKYKWHQVTRRVLRCLWKRTRQEITGSSSVQALIVKSEAHQYAQKLWRVDWNRSVRITSIEWEGARLVKCVIWRDGRWLE